MLSVVLVPAFLACLAHAQRLRPARTGAGWGAPLDRTLGELDNNAKERQIGDDFFDNMWAKCGTPGMPACFSK